ncbi:sulfur carrier protein ThiS [Pelodictyon luteolum]|uniref:ThiS, thiamine-biosynthesis n=1 Tax=Chlorobium luteolum (strain DSM 273 / BCRC 81028 / 2530) TaxID=319225 RepID=Q3B2L3_CHLL3|nr:sulfur carrier protein ThiS [Pelodictyon luteolum]ABB24418.1 ThiS, thiamine-biosynthesis [Pelodictyon luteolum DSM 273]
MLTIELNGKPEPVVEGSTVADMLAILGADGRKVATVVNEHIVRPPERTTAVLQDGDRVEILVFAGGG